MHKQKSGFLKELNKNKCTAGDGELGDLPCQLHLSIPLKGKKVKVVFSLISQFHLDDSGDGTQV